MLPPNLGSAMGLPVVALLQLLETSTGLGFCHYCYHVGSRCTCMGTYQPTPPQSWSQIVEQTPGYGVTASSGGMTTPSTTVAGMSGYVAPPPGLTLPDFSGWRLPLPEVPPSGGLPTAPPGLPGVGRATMLRGAAERHARAQMEQCPGGLTQRAQTQPMLAPCIPQMVPPLFQPLPGRPATPYQQVVQLPKKSTGRGVASNPSTDKTAPVGGASSQDHGRPTIKGQGDGGRSVSRLRGRQGKASVQPPHQEGDLPSGSMPSVPPPAAPEGTQPQHGGRPRSALHDPTRLAARFRSTRWKKDLEHVLRVYYKYNAASFKEVDWVSLKETFFAYFLPHKEEALGIKERCPIDYMVCIQEHFNRATGLHLNGFTAWIKQGSYYHGVVAQQGHLQECPHLAGLPLPRWPQVMPNESRRESQMKAEATATSSSKPSAGAMAAPVTETPVAETPGAETPVAETPAAPSDTPAPMETGGAGDSQSWAKRMEAGVCEEFQQDRPMKRRRSQSKRREPKQTSKPMLPFPLQENEGRLCCLP